MNTGPLSHLTVIEFAGLGPAPFAAMMLADHGARVIRIDRPSKATGERKGMDSLLARDCDVLSRGRESLELDLKQPGAKDIVLRLVERADILIEGFRPGVMESLGLGPKECLQRRPRLVYGRATGWGQTGPLAQVPGHDINFIALSGALHSTTRRGQGPTPTPGLIGDFGGGGMLLAFGVMAAASHAQTTGVGQVVDAAIVDGSALLTALIHGWHSRDLWSSEAGSNSGDGGAHFYDVYLCSDGKYISVGAMEPQFYAVLREKCGLTDQIFDRQWDKKLWPQMKARLAEIFRQKTRQQWCQVLEGVEACFAPVLDLSEAPQHPHNKARGTFCEVNGVTQPAPAPRFYGTPSAPCRPVGEKGADSKSILSELGLSSEEIESVLVNQKS